jgi:hypothetical protein
MGLWMKGMIGMLALLVALAGTTLAQETGAEADGAAVAEDTAAEPMELDVEYARQAFPDFGFALELPEHGELVRPGDDGWEAEDQVAFEWYGLRDDPVVLVQMRVDQMDTELNAAAFDAFCETLVANWSGDPGNYKVTTNNEPISLGDFSWRLTEVEDSSAGGGQSVYYSVFTTYAGDKIYTLSMYYLQPIDDYVTQFGVQMPLTFELL